jgi:metal-sulfur cluster biosynthetic enzyme
VEMASTGDLAKNAKELVYELVEEETGRKLGELTIVTEVFEVTPGVVKIRFTPLSVYSPTAVDLGKRIRASGEKVEGVKKVVVECSGHMQDDLINRLVNTEKSP